MILDLDTGWLRGARRVPSPNCDPRPMRSSLSLIVVHGISLPPGEFGGGWIDDLFVNQLSPSAHPYFAEIARLRVSAHALIRREGGLTQYVSFEQRAWHAGESCHRGRSACNDFSIGIELEGADDVPYEAEQYEVLARLVRTLRRAYPTLEDAEIVGHCDIAPGRKSDPGPSFEWMRLSALLETSR